MYIFLSLVGFMLLFFSLVMLIMPIRKWGINRMRAFWYGLPLSTFLLVCGVANTPPSPEEKAPPTVEANLKGLHCLTAPPDEGGRHLEFIREVKSRLDDPHSFQHITTTVGEAWQTLDSPGYMHLITMCFNARNYQGRITEYLAIGGYLNSNCKVFLPSDIVIQHAVGNNCPKANGK